MLTAQERAGLIDQIRCLPDQIEYLAGVLTPEEMSRHFLPGEWSAAQNIHHLADSHMNSYIRCRLMLTEEEPPLKPYDQDRWAVIPDAEGVDVTPSLLILRGLHGRWVQFFEALREEDWPRTGLHPERGLVTIEDQLKLYAGHGQGHVDQIRRTVAAQYRELPTTSDELLARIDREWARLHGLVERIPAEQMETPLEGGWSPKEHMAHVTAWERFLRDYVIGGRPVHEALGIPADQVEPWDVDRINAAIVQAGAGRSMAETLAAFERVHTDTRAAVAGITWSEWHEQIDERYGEPQPRLEWIAGNSYGHYLEHWQWLPVF